VYASVCWFRAFGWCCKFPKSLLITFPLFPVAVYLQKFCQYSLKAILKPVHKFLIRALFPLLNGMLHHQYIVSALKIIIYDSIICFCLQTLEMNVKLNKIYFFV